MGITASKSPLERRNTVVRRSQRRSIHNIKSKLEKVFQDIKKFKGTDEDNNFNALLSELDHLRIELQRKSKDLQPQVRDIHHATLKRIDECEQTLRDKMTENLQKANKKTETEQEKARKKEEKNKTKLHETTERFNDITVIQEVPEETEERENMKEEIQEAQELTSNPEKIKNVEVKFVQIISPEDSQQEQNISNKVASTEEKRKSILKMGIPVMPGAMMNDITQKSKKILERYSSFEIIQRTEEEILSRVNEIIENLQAMECQIADFVGRKNGTQYHRIKDQLNNFLIELNQINTVDEYLTDQLKLCKNFVASNLSFLEEKAVQDNKSDSNDDVFRTENNNVPLSPVEMQQKLRKLTKTTAI